MAHGYRVHTKNEDAPLQAEGHRMRDVPHATFRDLARSTASHAHRHACQT